MRITRPCRDQRPAKTVTLTEAAVVVMWRATVNLPRRSTDGAKQRERAKKLVGRSASTKSTRSAVTTITTITTTIVARKKMRIPLTEEIEKREIVATTTMATTIRRKNTRRSTRGTKKDGGIRDPRVTAPPMIAILKAEQEQATTVTPKDEEAVTRIRGETQGQTRPGHGSAGREHSLGAVLALLSEERRRLAVCLNPRHCPPVM